MASKRFIPRNPDKYAGDARYIVSRSSWEYFYMQALDSSNLVAKWISEPKTLGIKYVNPIDRKLHEYWPDFLVQYVNNQIEIIEIKPLKESMLSPKASQYDKLMLAKNISKWKAAEVFAKKIGASFRVVTEAQLKRGKK